MTVFALVSEQPDDQIKAGHPTRILGFFSTERLAQKALERIKLFEGARMLDVDATGALNIYAYDLNVETWNEGFFTENHESE